MEGMQIDVDIIKKAVREHSEKLQRLASAVMRLSSCPS